MKAETTAEPKNEEAEDTRTDEEIARELGFEPGDKFINLNGSVEDIADAIFASVCENLAKKGHSFEEMDTWTDETHPDPELEANERANAEYMKKHGIIPGSSYRLGPPVEGEEEVEVAEICDEVDRLAENDLDRAADELIGSCRRLWHQQPADPTTNEERIRVLNEILDNADCDRAPDRAAAVRAAKLRARLQDRIRPRHWMDR